jgi:hypothetical protein
MYNVGVGMYNAGSSPKALYRLPIIVNLGENKSIFPAPYIGVTSRSVPIVFDADPEEGDQKSGESP